MGKTIRKIYAALICAALLVLAGSCTRNNGDIGPWFGTWHLTAIETDGTPDADYEGNIFWKFQNDVLQLTMVPVDEPGNHETTKRFGTWAEEQGNLQLCFAYKSDSDPEGWMFHPFEELHLPYGGTVTLQIVKRPGREAVLQYASEDGKTYTYRLKKQG